MFSPLSKLEIIDLTLPLILIFVNHLLCFYCDDQHRKFYLMGSLLFFRLFFVRLNKINICILPNNKRKLQEMFCVQIDSQFIQQNQVNGDCSF